MNEIHRDADTVQVWLVPFRRTEAELAELFAVLDPEERSRADACLAAGDRRDFITAHGAMRHIVARRLRVPADELSWERGPHGKPGLAGKWVGPQVNLSHSGEFAMVAVSAARAVGVDVQLLLPHTDVAAMSHRFYPPEEAGFVLAGPRAEDRTERFARLWTRKEALVKAHGGRLTQGLSVPVQASGEAVVDYPDPAGPATYRIAELPAPPGYRAAVALAGPGGYRVEQFPWTGP